LPDSFDRRSIPAQALALSKYRGSTFGSSTELSDDEQPGASLGWTEGQPVHHAPLDSQRPHLCQTIEDRGEVPT